jgi:hypothetical protein
MDYGCTYCKELFEDLERAEQHVKLHAIVHDKTDPRVGSIPAVRENVSEDDA